MLKTYIEQILVAVSINCSIYIYIYIYIYISLSCHAANLDFHDSLSTLVYYPSLPAGLLDYFLYPYRTVVDKFLLVSQHLHIRVSGSIREHCLWVCLYFSSCVPHVLFVFFWMVLEIGSRWRYSCFFYGMVLPGFVQHRSQHSCTISVKLFLFILYQRPCGASILWNWHDHCFEKNVFYYYDSHSNHTHTHTHTHTHIYIYIKPRL